MPLHFIDQARQEVRLAMLRRSAMRVEARFRSRRGLLVNLGAGGRALEGWINVDIRPAPGVNCIFDVRKHLPFADGSVRAIFCEHLLEHLDYTEEIPYFMHECHRALEPGGVLRIVVPDAERYLHAYVEGGWDALAALRPLDEHRTDRWFGHRYRTRMELVNFVFRQGLEHRFAYDFETLRFVLERFGFARVERQRFGCSSLPELDIDTPARESESLYVEGIKAASGSTNCT